MSDSSAPSPQRPAHWRSAPAPAGGSGRGALRAVALIALLAAAGGLAGLWFWIAPPKPVRLLTVPVSEYSDAAWPLNPWAERDSELLRSVFPGESEKAFNFQERDRLTALLDSLRTESQRPVVLHVSALATFHGGLVYLLPGHAKPDEPATWLPLNDLLDTFAACPAPHKLLFLDIAHPTADLFRGPFVEEIGTTVSVTIGQRKLNYFLLCSCGPSEASLSLEDEQASAFAYYVGLGLEGPADGYNPAQERDGRVSARELAAFVAARVSRWAQRARGQSQTPTLFGEAADFPLTFQTRSAPEPNPPPMEYPAPLLNGWKRRDDWRTARSYSSDPLAFARMQGALLRAERAIDAGLAERAERRLAGDLAALTDRGAARAVAALPRRTLAAHRAGRPDPPADLIKALDAFLAVRAAAPKPDELAKARTDFLEKAKANPTDAAGLIWDRLLAEPEPAAGNLRDLKALFTDVKPPPCEEAFLLARLAAWEPRSIPWPASAINAMLRAEGAAGRALARLPDAFPWASVLFDEADSSKRDGEAQLFAATTLAAVRTATERLEIAERQFAEAQRQLAVVQRTRRTVSDAAVALTSTAHNAVVGTVEQPVWSAATSSVALLADKLAAPHDGRAMPLADWERPLGTLENALRTVTRPFAPTEVQRRVTAAKDGGPAELKALRDLLRDPMAAAPERKAVCEAARRLSRRLHETVRQLDAADDEARRVTPAPTTPTDTRDNAWNVERRVSQVSIGLLHAAGIPTAGWPTGADRHDMLRPFWTKRLPNLLRDSVAKKDWRAADRASRFVLPELAEPSTVLPAIEMARQEDAACRRWLEGRYRVTGTLRAAVPGAAAFYEETAALCRLPQ